MIHDGGWTAISRVQSPPLAVVAMKAVIALLEGKKCPSSRAAGPDPLLQGPEGGCELLQRSAGQFPGRRRLQGLRCRPALPGPAPEADARQHLSRMPRFIRCRRPMSPSLAPARAGAGHAWAAAAARCAVPGQRGQALWRRRRARRGRPSRSRQPIDPRRPGRERRRQVHADQDHRRRRPARRRAASCSTASAVAFAGPARRRSRAASSASSRSCR